MNYCKSCVLPDTRPNLVLGEDGICNACHSHEKKDVIDWAARERQLLELVEQAKNKSQGYDCLIPVSGGKDSTWQTVKCLEYGLNPLTITYSPPLRTELGERNLSNLINLGIDHIDHRVNPKVEAAFLLAALEKFGNVGIPSHMAVQNMARRYACYMQIPLIIWGENSSFEYGGKGKEHDGFKQTDAWLNTHGVMHGTTITDWVSDQLSEKSLMAFSGAKDSALSAAGVQSIFLGYFMKWDPEKTRDMAISHGMEISDSGPCLGLWDYADMDDRLMPVHHWLKWFKFGFTRTFDNLSIEIRNGRMSRTDAVEYIRSHGDETPLEDIEAFCDFTAISTARFFEMAEKWRNPDIWRQEGGVWKVPGFLIDDWQW